jgi:hypothetical protein
VYKVNNTAVTELNLLGNLGNATFRKVGDLYGIILLPDSATGADIEAARKLLIDRGGSDGVSVTSLSTFWYDRSDILEFQHINTSNVTSFAYSWVNCSNLQSFPLLNSSSVLNMQNSWQNNISLKSFPAIQAENCSNFLSAWQGCTALTSFPAGAKLGTEATNVSFTSAWKSSGLTSFSTPLPSGDSFYASWRDCTNLSSFSSEINGTNVRFTWYGCSSLTSFSTPLPLAGRLDLAWQNCTSLLDFSADVFANWNPSTISTGIFNGAWDGCSALSAQSVENILTSIAASNQYATVDGNSGSAAIADAAIDIDYNAASGSLSAATNTAVSALKGRGWSIIVNNVTL